MIFYFTLDLKQMKQNLLPKWLNNSCTYFHLNRETKRCFMGKTKRTAILFSLWPILITLMIYNFIFLFTKKVYLYYVLMILGVVYNPFSYTGMFYTNSKIFNASDEFIYNYTIVDAYLGIYYYIALYVFIVLFYGSFC